MTLQLASRYGKKWFALLPCEAEPRACRPAFLACRKQGASVDCECASKAVREAEVRHRSTLANGMDGCRFTSVAAAVRSCAQAPAAPGLSLQHAISPVFSYLADQQNERNYKKKQPFSTFFP